MEERKEHYILVLLMALFSCCLNKETFILVLYHALQIM